jgi:hypothetical protein
MFLFNFTYRLTCPRVPQVEYHWSTKYGNLDVSQHYRPPRPVIGVPLPVSFYTLWRVGDAPFELMISKTFIS